MSQAAIATDLGQPLPSEMERVRRGDFLLVACFCLVLFGCALFDGRPLTMHEARLPETSREMLASGDWLIPRSGGRPWLERPPLPHWITIGLSRMFGQRPDRVWIVRLPSALMGCITVLLVMWMAGRWFGRGVGITSGLVLATMYEFYTYSTLAEDDIYLAALSAVAMALFVLVESLPTKDPKPGLLRTLFGPRPWPILALFIVLGLTSLVKGPLMGAVGVIGALVAYLTLNRDGSGFRRYCWAPGWLVFLALSLWWPIVVERRYPELLENLKFDYAGGTSQYDQWFGYYLPTLLAVIAPWTLMALLGLWFTARRARDERFSPERLVWCWAIVPVLILSIPHRKHHHYLVPCLGPWAVLAAVGVMAFTKWLVGYFRGLNAKLVLTVTFGVVAMAFGLGHAFLPEETTQDTAFLARVVKEAPLDEPLFINGDLHGELDFFRIAFYLPARARLLHNLTYLRDQNLRAPEVLVITRARDAGRLATLGTVELVDQSAHTRREKSAEDRFTLFRLRFTPDLQRYPAPTDISTMQAMGRKKGPYCGPAFSP